MSRTEQIVIFLIMIVGALTIAFLNDYLMRRSARKREAKRDPAEVEKERAELEKERAAQPPQPPPAMSSAWALVTVVLIAVCMLLYSFAKQNVFPPGWHWLQSIIVNFPIIAVALGVTYVAGKIGLATWKQRHARRAFHLIKEGHTDQAIEMLQERLRTRGPNFDVLNTLVVPYIAQKELDKAMQTVDAAEACLPNQAVLHNNRATILRDQGHSEAANESFRKAHTLAPFDFYYAANYGLQLAKMGQIDEATTLLKNAERILKNWYLLGAANRKQLQTGWIDPLRESISAAQENPSRLES
jgi:tetratricopeptide (TPR) repeat protein